MSRNQGSEIDALRQATREAHEALKDLRHERRTVERLLDEVDKRVENAVDALIAQQVHQQMEQLGKVTEKAMRDAVAKVFHEFDRLERLFTGPSRTGDTLEDGIRRYVNQRDGRL